MGCECWGGEDRGGGCLNGRCVTVATHAYKIGGAMLYECVSEEGRMVVSRLLFTLANGSHQIAIQVSRMGGRIGGKI